ncbi:MAG: hypothetical protein FJY97_03550 [candidate division Zixibacteria bacterium]|nr:hypothetical protein [candidate division Zixibacteria bacterium]
MIIIASTIVLLCSVQILFAGEAHVDKQAKNKVVFTSEVVALTFSGITDRIDGYLYWEGDLLFQRNTQFRFEVDLNTSTPTTASETETCSRCWKPANGRLQSLKGPRFPS